jgi:TonB family protein
VDNHQSPIKFVNAWIVAVTAWTLAAATGAPAVAQSRLTPGTAALLSGSRSAGNLKILRDGLTDNEPGVRAVTARIAGFLDRTEMAGDIERALAKEQDATAASEQARALLYLQGADARTRVTEAAARHDAVRSILAEWLARTRPAEFEAALLPLLRGAAAPDARTIGRITVMAILQTPRERERIIAALAGAESGIAWRAFLDGSRLRLDSQASSLKIGLASSNAAVREATIWFGVSGLAAGTLSVSDVKTALAAPVGWLPTDESEWAAFGRDLLARRLVKSPASEGSSTIERYALEHSADGQALGSLRELTNAERTTLRRVFPDLADAPQPRETVPPQARPTDTKAGPLPMRTVTALTRGFLASLLAATGCTPPTKAGAFGAARIFYHSDGRPARTEYDVTTLGPDCALFVRELAAVEVPPPDQPVIDGVPQWLYVPMNNAAIDCADQISASIRAEALDVGLTPKKIHDQKPVYPEAMQQARVQGVVTIEGIISSSGCVVGAKIQRSVAMPLDLAALRAVLDWRFSPALLEGKPVPVIITVTVFFRLE